MRPSQQEIPGIWQFQGGGIALAHVRAYLWNDSVDDVGTRVTRDSGWACLDVWIDGEDPIKLEPDDDPDDFIRTLHLYWETMT